MSSRPALPQGPYLVVGMARSGVAAALALRKAQPSAEIVGCDSGMPEEVELHREQLESAGVKLYLESKGVELLSASPAPKTVIKSPGVPADAEVVVAARAAGLEVVGELELAWRLLSNRFCAVTGTNGKTTTTALIGEICKAAELPVAVVGNIGKAASSLVGEINEDVIVISEVSSFQLEDSICFAPDIALLLNVSPDHIDRHGSEEEYLAAKMKIFSNQSAGQIAILNANLPIDDADIAGSAERVWFGVDQSGDRQVSAHLGEGKICWKKEELIASDQLAIRGPHNLENALAAVAAAKAFGIESAAIVEALKNFKGVEHRLEEVAQIDGVTYINDSKATNVASTVVALRSFPSGIHLIAGGSLKGGGFTALKDLVKTRCVACYLIGEAAPVLAQDLEESGIQLRRCQDLAQAVAFASEVAKPGEVVLLSPACASFDQFDSFEDRGNRYRELITGPVGTV